MKKKLGILAALLVVLAAVTGWRMAHRETLPEFAGDQVAEMAAGTVNQLIRAIDRRDAAAIRQLWVLPEKELAMDCLQKIGRTPDGVFSLMSASYDGANHDRVLVTGTMPQGNFSELTLEKRDGAFRIVAMDIQ